MDLRPVDMPGFAAVVRLCGEHDLATSDELRAGLASIHGNVIVDLTDCEFIDSTAIGIIVANRQEREREGQSPNCAYPPRTHRSRARSQSRASGTF